MNNTPNPIQTIKQAEQYFKEVLSTASKRTNDACAPVLGNPKFWTWAAAKSYHHAHLGGLAVHTAQVLQAALCLSSAYNVNREVLIVGAVWHDMGKLYEYDCSDLVPTRNSRWDYSDHIKLVYHLPRSAIEFGIWNASTKLYNETEFQLIEHVILSSHGRLEWQSPVEPVTLEGFAVSSGDMVSSKYTTTERP